MNNCHFEEDLELGHDSTELDRFELPWWEKAPASLVTDSSLQRTDTVVSSSGALVSGVWHFLAVHRSSRFHDGLIKYRTCNFFLIVIEIKK